MSLGAFHTLLFCCFMLVSSTAKDKDLTVTCTDSEQCVLPCQFQSDGKGARIMWYVKGAIVSCTRYGDTSFVEGSNSQVDSYKGRTGLFVDEVLEGNAALTLRNVTPHDQDKYFCVTMTAPRTDQPSAVSLVIKAPVRSVDIGFRDGGVTCSSKRIYPRPSLVWSTDPPTEAGRLQNWTVTKENHQGFYDIQSSLQLKESNVTDKTYICRVATDANQRTAFLKRQASIQACSGTNVTVRCDVPLSSRSYNVTWTFGDRDPILSIAVTERRPLVEVYGRWKPHEPANLQSRGELTLVRVEVELQGTYSCEVNTLEETHVVQTEVLVRQDTTNIYIYSFMFVLALVGIVLVIIFIIRNVGRAESPAS